MGDCPWAKQEPAKQKENQKRGFGPGSQERKAYQGGGSALSRATNGSSKMKTDQRGQ